MEKKRLGWERESRGKGGGAAPFASVEDLSDDSPEAAVKLEVPGSTRAVAGGSGTGGGPPRIDISRASSSSHHEDSSPERELFTGEGGGSVKVGLGFTEDMALELRSSTEELDFHEPEPERKSKKKKLHQQQAVIVTKYELETDSEKENRERKDSGCSEGGLLYIGGRSSRLSSIGSAASGGSGVSAGSGVSHLSAASNYSRASRCSSPHKMLLETSFCGPKPIPTLSLEAEYPPSESVEAALLKRKADPAGAILPNCLEVAGGGKPRRTSSERTVRPAVVPAVRSSSARAPKKPTVRKKYDENALVRIIPLHGSVDEPEDDDQEEIQIAEVPPCVAVRTSTARAPKKSATKKKYDENALVRIIPLHGSVDEPEDDDQEEIKIAEVPPCAAVRSSTARAPKKPASKKKYDENALVRIIPLHGSVDEPEDDDQEKIQEESKGRHDEFHPENGIYIPLKGPIIDTRPERVEAAPPRRQQAEARREPAAGRSKQEGSTPRSRQEDDTKRKKPQMEDTDLVRFISLHGDDDETNRSNQTVQFRPRTDPTEREYMDLSNWPKHRARSPDPPKPGRLELEKKKNGRSLGQIPRDDSRTPSPASSFTRGNIFRRSSDSSGSSKKSLSSCDSKTKKDSRNKSMFTALFKKNVKETPVKRPQPERAPIDPKLTNVEYKFRQEEHVIDKDTIIIPLHSPDEVVEPLIRYDPEREQNDLGGRERRVPGVPERRAPERRVPERKQPPPESQRSSVETHTIEKNIVVVDVINEDTKEPPIKTEPRTPSEPKKVVKEIKRKVDELEVYDYEPRVRRSSSICSRETDAVSMGREERKEVEKDEPEIICITVRVEEQKSKPVEAEIVTVGEDETDDGRDRKSGDTEETLSKSESGETCRQASQETVIENHLSREEEFRKERSPVEEDLLGGIMQDEEIESLIKREEESENNITKSESHERRSSESEAEVEPVKEPPHEETDEERKGLFLQTDSMDDELPYVPTTLPQERCVGLPIIPIRQRVSEVKTCPVERPRSTTPIQPSNLEEYAAFHEPRPISQEKMQITLPRTDSVGKGRGRGKGSPPPPLPPRAPQWVAFDEPERRRPPRRITTLPLTYVNPEECTCECHDLKPTETHCSKPQHCPAKQTRTDKEKRYRQQDR